MSYTLVELTSMCEKIANDNGAELICPVKINGRLTKTHGRVIYKNINDNVVPSVIEFSKKLIETASEESIQEVVKHEMCHYLVTIKTKETHGHDRTFKLMCEKIGATFNSATANVKYIIPTSEAYKYTVTCSSCGHTGYYSRAGKVVKHPENYLCKCGGSLVVTQNW